MRRQRAVASPNPADRGRSTRRGSASSAQGASAGPCAEHLAGLLARSARERSRAAGLLPERNQFDIVHDDEVIEVREQARHTGRRQFRVRVRRLRATRSGRPGCVPARSAPGSRRRRSGARSFTVLVTMPLSQRKRSSPRTATRRIQPRSCTAAPESQRRYFTSLARPTPVGFVRRDTPQAGAAWLLTSIERQGASQQPWLP